MCNNKNMDTSFPSPSQSYGIHDQNQKKLKQFQLLVSDSFRPLFLNQPVSLNTSLSTATEIPL